MPPRRIVFAPVIVIAPPQVHSCVASAAGRTEDNTEILNSSLRGLMKHLLRIALLLVLGVPMMAAPHDRAFWKAIAANDYRVPEGESAAALMDEVIEMYASPDPEVRDDLGYSITAAWVYGKKVLTPDELRPLTKKLLENLSRDLDRSGDAPVLRRSFSALALSTIAARDNAQPFLTQEEFDEVLERTIAYLGAERDLRGFDPKVGWIHATAHTADVLKFLARSQKLRVPQQRAILDGVAKRLATANVAYTHDEEERLARVCISLIARSDFDAAGFNSWLQQLDVPQFAASEPVLVRRGNTKHFLESLFTLVTLDERFANAAPAAEARTAILAALRKI